MDCPKCQARLEPVQYAGVEVDRCVRCGGLWFDPCHPCCGIDGSIPIVVPMRWNGDTPMIMMTETSLPRLGTFTVRVFFYGDRYDGTWQHGAVGGHMFGRIEKHRNP